MSHRIVALCCWFMVTASAHAELPPGSYDNLRAKADEAVTMQVSSVTVNGRGTYKDISITAKVLGVERSKAGLKKGEGIRSHSVIEFLLFRFLVHAPFRSW